MKGSYKLQRAMIDLVNSMRRLSDTKFEQAISARQAVEMMVLAKRKTVLGF